MYRWPLLALTMLLLALLAFFVVVLNQETPTTFLNLFGVERKITLLEFIGLSMGGVLLAIQAVISHTRAKAMEDAVGAQTQANAMLEMGQKQERLKTAIEHLGHNSESVRLGGAFELFHLAKDVSEFRQTVFDILCAHIRSTTMESEYRKQFCSNPSEEIQSILTLLFVEEYKAFEGLRADLRRSWLNGADLRYAHLDRADLWQIHLKNAGLLRASLQGVILMEADVRGAEFYGVDLREALLSQSDFRESRLIHADLQGVSADGAKFHGAELQCANLRGANLANTRFQVSDLTCATLESVVLDNANFVGADLFLAHFDGATRKSPDKYSFREIVRTRVRMDADLSGATFEGGVTQEDIEDAVGSLADESSKHMRQKLEAHLGKAKSNVPSKAFDVSEGSYSNDVAEEWIEEFEKGLSEKPEWRPLPKFER